jgi:hypothetical protein
LHQFNGGLGLVLGFIGLGEAVGQVDDLVVFGVSMGLSQKVFSSPVVAN